MRGYCRIDIDGQVWWWKVDCTDVVIYDPSIINKRTVEWTDLLCVKVSNYEYKTETLKVTTKDIRKYIKDNMASW